MKLHVALLSSALLIGGCAESVEEIPGGDVPVDSGATGDTSSGKDSAPADTGGGSDTGSSTDDTGGGDDSGSMDDSGEFPDFGGGDDSGSSSLDGGTSTSDGGSGTMCTKKEDCPGGCCDTASGKCGVEFFGICLAF